MILVLVLRAGVLAFAAWGVFQRQPRYHVPAGLIVASEILGYFLAKAVLIDDLVFHDLTIEWAMWGPLFIPMAIVREAPTLAWLVLPPVAAGLAATAFVWIRLWRLSARRVWTYVALAAGMLVAWIVAEIEVDTVMRGAAPGCDISRTSTVNMIIYGLSSPASGSHGYARDARQTAHVDFAQRRYARWSFRGGYSRQIDCRTPPSP